MEMTATEIVVNGVTYVPKGAELAEAEKVDGMPYVIVRSEKAGVFAAYLKSRKDGEVELVQSRRIFYWDGAASLSQLAQEGTTAPQNCKFPLALPSQTVLGVIEIIPVSEKARLNIAAVPVWKR